MDLTFLSHICPRQSCASMKMCNYFEFSFIGAAVSCVAIFMSHLNMYIKLSGCSKLLHVSSKYLVIVTVKSGTLIHCVQNRTE